MSDSIDFQPIDQGATTIDFQPTDQSITTGTASVEPSNNDLPSSIGSMASKAIGYAQKAVPYVSAFTSGNPMEGVSQYDSQGINDASARAAAYIGNKVQNNLTNNLGDVPSFIPKAAGITASLIANPLNYSGMGETGAGSQVSKGLDPAVAASREARTGVPARQFQALYNDPGAIFAGDKIKQAGQDIGSAKISSGINPGVTNDVASLTPDNIDRINPTKATKIDDIQTVLGQIQNGQPPTPQQAQNALDSVNSILSQPTVQNNADVFRQWSAIKTHINSALADVAPDVRSANQAYAREKLGQSFEGMEAVNKNGKPSKLGMIAQGGSAAIGALLGGLTDGHPFIGGAAGYKAGEIANQMIHAPYVAGLQTALEGYLSKKFGSVPGALQNTAGVPVASAIQNYIDRRNNQGGQ